MRMYVIANEDCVLGFSLVGVTGVTVKDGHGLREAIKEALEDKSIGILLISQDVSIWAREYVDELKVRSLSPVVVDIPGESSETSYASLQDFVQHAVGIRLEGN